MVDDELRIRHPTRRARIATGMLSAIVAQVFQRSGREAAQPPDDFRMSGGDVVSFSNIPV